MSVSSQHVIVQWKEFIPEATETCKRQFEYMMKEQGFDGLEHDDILVRIFQRYVLYLKLIHHRVKRYFREAWAIDGVTEQFSKKEAKWLLAILQKRVESKNVNLDLKTMESILLWVGLRYNFWLVEQLK